MTRLTTAAGMALLAGLLAALAATAGRAADAPPAPAPGGIQTEEMEFDVVSEAKKSGHVRIKIMTVKDLTVIDEEFAAPPIGGREVALESRVTYRGAEKPVLGQAKATTFLAGFKMMDGTVTFTPAAGGWSAKEEISAYADADRKPFVKPVVTTKDAALAASMVLTRASFIYFAPRLLTKPGQIEKVAYLRLPAGVVAPALTEYSLDAVLERRPADDNGRVEFVLKRIFSGGNAIPVMTMIRDREGRLVEITSKGYTYTPASPGGYAPAPAAATTPAPAAKPAAKAAPGPRR